MKFFLLLVRLNLPGPFVVDAEWEEVFPLEMRACDVRPAIGSTEFLARTMPGVVEIRPLGEGEFLYRTERSMPFAGVVRTDFRLRRDGWTDSSVVFRTPAIDERNYMILALSISTGPEGEALLHTRLRVRLLREDPADVHPFASVLGEWFISGQMERDLKQILAAFAERVNSGSYLPMLTGREGVQ